MDALERARQKSFKRMLAKGLPEDVAARKAGLVNATPQDIAPVQPEPVVTPKMESRPETKKGKVLIEVIVYLNDEPIDFLYSTDMRGALLKTQQNRKFLGAKFSEFLQSFLGRVDELPGRD